MDTTNNKMPSKRTTPYSTLHQCPECHEEFHGRKNRIFCSLECKIRSNNAKAFEKNYRVREHVLMLKKNAEILEEVYNSLAGAKSVKKEELLKRGFNFECPTIRLKDENGAEWHLIGNYVIKPEKDSMMISIMTKNDLKRI